MGADIGRALVTAAFVLVTAGALAGGGAVALLWWLL
jgi:hypothetical protein